MDINEIKEESQNYKKELEKKTETVDNLIKEVASLHTKVTYLENQSRRNNIRINGIPEDPKETWDDNEDKLKSAISQELDLGFEPEIERAHRVGPALKKKDCSPIERPGTIVCKLYDWKVKETILSEAWKKKPHDVY